MNEKRTENKAWLIVRILVTVGVLGFLGWKMRGELADFVATVRQANIPWLVIGYAGFALVILFAVLRWQLLLRAQALLLNFAYLVEYFMIGLFFNNFMLGATGGDFVRAYYVAKETHHKKTEAMTTVFIDRIVGMFALICWGLAALLFQLGNPQMKNISLSLVGLLGGFLVFVLVFMNKRVMRKIPFLEKVAQHIPFKDTIRRIYDAFHVYHSRKLVVLGAFFYSLFLQFIMILIVYGLGHALNIQGVGFLHYMLLVPVISTVAALPISFGGLGLGEGAYVYFFNLVTEQSAKYLALALSVRFLIVLWSLIGGLFLMLPKSRIPAGELEAADEVRA